MRMLSKHLVGALCLGLIRSTAVSAGGMDEPVAEPVAVVVTPPSLEPVYTGVYLPEAVSIPDQQGSGADKTPETFGVSMSSDGRVLCLTVPKSRRGGTRAFDLCQP